MDRLIPRLSAEEQAAFIAAARSLVGTPFKHHGRNTKGVDCLGVVAYALRAIGHRPQDARNYPRSPEPEASRLREALTYHFGEPVKHYAPSCVVTMQWHGVPNHVAVIADYYAGGLSVIHATTESKFVIETRIAGPWPRRIMEAWQP